jgi:hypothetical protein
MMHREQFFHVDHCMLFLPTTGSVLTPADRSKAALYGTEGPEK